MRKVSKVGRIDAEGPSCRRSAWYEASRGRGSKGVSSSQEHGGGDNKLHGGRVNNLDYFFILQQPTPRFLARFLFDRELMCCHQIVG